MDFDSASRPYVIISSSKLIGDLSQPGSRQFINLDGARACDAESFYNALEDAIPLLGGWGRNLDALEDALRDGDVLSGRSILIRISQGEKFLSEAPQPWVASLLSVFSHVGEQLSKPCSFSIPPDWFWAQGPIPFHVVIEVEPGSSREAFWTKANASAAPIGGA